MVNALKFNYSETAEYNFCSKQQVQTFIIDCFSALNTTGALPGRSFREYLQMDLALQKIDSGLIRDIMNAVWSRCTGSNKKFSEDTLERVIFPALFSRNVVLRNLEEKDLNRVQRKLTIGKLEEMNCILLETLNPSKRLKPYGAIYYYQQDENMWVESLKIHSKKEGVKYGNLLLSAVYMQAKAKQCSQINLLSTEEGLPLYLSFGFVPFPVLASKEITIWWESLSLDVKIAIVQKMVYYLVFDIDNIEKISQNLEKSLNFFSHPISRPLVFVEIPKEAYDFGLLERENTIVSEGFTSPDDMDQYQYPVEPSQDTPLDCIDQYFLEFEEYSAS